MTGHKWSRCAHAQPEAWVSRPTAICRHRPLGGARPAPRSQEQTPAHTPAPPLPPPAFGPQLPRAQLASGGGGAQQVSGLRKWGGGQSPPRQSRRAAGSPKRHAGRRQPESTCGFYGGAARPPKQVLRSFCAPQLQGSIWHPTELSISRDSRHRGLSRTRFHF